MRTDRKTVIAARVVGLLYLGLAVWLWGFAGIFVIICSYYCGMADALARTHGTKVDHVIPEH